MRANTIAERSAVSSVDLQSPRSHEYLTFKLGAEKYAIDILRVQEIRSYEPPTRLAGAPDIVCGVLNLRGVVVPVVDLRARFASKAAFDTSTVIIVLNVDNRTDGAVVDAVSDVIKLLPEQITPAPEFGGVFAAQQIVGIGTVQQDGHEHLLLLLDIEGLICSASMGLGSASQ
jgi:purine-binding chemotaxis protein CheW